MKGLLDLYHTFYMVAKQMSFSKAADELFVSQSAVSQSIKTLESRLNITLLIRSTKKMYLTADGEILFNQLEHVFTIINNAEAMLTDRRYPNKGHITIAATDTLCKYFLLPRIKKLNQKFPEIKIKIYNGTSKYCLEMLATAQVDFAVANFPAAFDQQLFKVEREYKFQDVFTANHDFKIDKPLTLNELIKHPLLVLDKESVTWQFLDTIFQKQGLVIQPEIELQNVDLLIEMCRIGLGISFLPDFCLTHSGLQIIPVKNTIPARSYGIFSLQKLSLIPVAETFLSICEA